MTTEAELKEAVKKLLCFGFCGEDDSDAEDEFICSPLCKTNQQSTAEAIHSLYIQAGYVMLTRDEAIELIDLLGFYSSYITDQEWYDNLVAKLRSRLEVKE
jgi:hypothetical protein